VRRSWVIALVIALVVVAVGGAGAALVLPGLRAKPDSTASRFLAGWSRADYPAMRALVDRPPANFDEQYKSMRSSLGITKARFSLGKVSANGTSATAPFTANFTLRGFGSWSYQASLELSRSTRFSREWTIDWSPTAIHPDFRTGDRFQRDRTWPERGSVLAQDGSVLAGPRGGAAGPASLTSLVGSVGDITADDLKRLGAPYQGGDQAGRSGIERSFERRLAGSPSGEVQLVDAQGSVVKVLKRFGGTAGASVKTTLSIAMQAAAESALQAGASGHEAAMVVMQPSTGAIRALVSLPNGGYPRATLGTYPPGSTFKVITTAALLAKGITPSSMVSCPQEVKIGGITIHNFEKEQLGNIPFSVAFAKSCNTAFVQLATQHLTGNDLEQAASRLGFGVDLAPGVASATSHFPVPQSSAELAMAAFGQARVSASPLEMASVASAIQSGTWRPPQVVDDQALSSLKAEQPEPRQLDPGTTATLRTLMRQVVTSGTAATAGLPAGVSGKTGTAEFGGGDNKPTHAWFIAFDGDLAVSVVVEGGGVGGEVAAPIAAKFFKSVAG
jgi:Penicillin binding protein transpeptidase domain/NTF2-like N-terminal transpeptidase domain/Penicillin-binding Protein dimerisation domain